MWRHPVLAAILLGYVGWGGWGWIADRPLHPPDGVLAADDPQQTDVASGAKVQVGHWTLTVRADYRVTARILARERYHFDALADRIFRRSPLVLNAFRRHHYGLRHHHGAVLRRRAMGNNAAGRHHHGFLDSTVLRRHDLLLIAGAARLRRRVAAVTSRGRGSRDGHCGDG